MQEGQEVVARVNVAGKTSQGDGQTSLSFVADYADGKNKEWAKYTPGLSLSMGVIDSVAEFFEQGESLELVLRKVPAGEQAAQSNETQQQD